MTRRGNGEGTAPRLRKDGTYVIDVTIDGKRRSIYGKTAALARANVREALRRAEAGQPLRDAKMTVATWAEKWVTSTLAGKDGAQATKDWYAGIVRNQIKPSDLGKMLVGQVRKADVDALYLDLRAAGYSASMLRGVHAALRALFTEAVDNELVKASPMDKVTRPAPGEHRAAFLTKDQAGVLVRSMEAESPMVLDLTKFLLLTGLRRGEALGMAWDAVGDDRLDVRQQLTRASDGLRLRKVKTRAGERSIPMSEPLADVLRSRRKAQMVARMAAGPAWVDSGLVFTTELGGPLDPRNVNRKFKAAVYRAGLPVRGAKAVTPHVLRHSAASFLLAAGVPMKVVQKILGHSSYSVTADIYSHVAPELETEAMGKLGEALGW